MSRHDTLVAGGDDDTRALEAWVYRPTAAPIDGAVLVAHGLHFDGPADPRMDRLCRILAASGTLVLAPFIRDYIDLRIVPRALDDLERAFVQLRGMPDLPPGCRPVVFSISFGSLLALRLASSTRRAGEVGGLLLFGGYADWAETVRFSLAGGIDGVPDAAHDPLTQPVVFMNLVHAIRGAPHDPTALIDHWLAYCRATWGRQELKFGDERKEVARTMAAGVPEPIRELFLIGCGAEPGGLELCMDALDRGTARSRFLDPRPHLQGLRCPVHLIHGLDDDIIPHGQLDELARALPPNVDCTTYSTGLYGHSRKASVRELIGNLPALARELWSMGRIMRALVRAPRVGAARGQAFR